MYDPNMVIIVPKDDLVHDDALPSADIVLDTNVGMVYHISFVNIYAFDYFAVLLLLEESVRNQLNHWTAFMF